VTRFGPAYRAHYGQGMMPLRPNIKNLMDSEREMRTDL
jgi:hypothetical protein